MNYIFKNEQKVSKNCKKIIVLLGWGRGGGGSWKLCKAKKQKEIHIEHKVEQGIS
jgi:hypothetical protein